MAITGYFIASATTPGDLTTTVNKYITLGWQPSGPVVRRDGNADICQAMIQGSADSGSSSYTLPAATPTTLGGVKMAAKIAALTAAPSETDFNGLLSALQAAGVMASS